MVPVRLFSCSSSDSNTYSSSSSSSIELSCMPIKRRNYWTLVGSSRPEKRRNYWTLIGGSRPEKRRNYWTLVGGSRPEKRRNYWTLIGGSRLEKRRNYWTSISGSRPFRGFTKHARCVQPKEAMRPTPTTTRSQTGSEHRTSTICRASATISVKSARQPHEGPRHTPSLSLLLPPTASNTSLFGI